MKLQTERLIITEFDLSMAEAVHLNSLDDDTRRFVPDEVFETVDDACEVLSKLIELYDSGDGPLVYPVLLTDGTNIGYVQLVPVTDGYEVGYHIAQAYTSNGYATEALKAFLDFILPLMRIDSVCGICLAENRASQRVLQKCGFVKVYEGVDNYQGEARETVKYILDKR